MSADIPSVTPEDGSNSTPLPCPSASCPATPQADVITSPPSFKFLKTKRVSTFTTALGEIFVFH